LRKFGKVPTFWKVGQSQGKSGNSKVTGKSGNFSFVGFNSAQMSDVNYKEVDVRVAATKLLSTVKLSDLEIMGFRKQCIDFLSSMTAKIIELRNILSSSCRLFCSKYITK